MEELWNPCEEFCWDCFGQTFDLLHGFDDYFDNFNNMEDSDGFQYFLNKFIFSQIVLRMIEFLKNIGQYWKI